MTDTWVVVAESSRARIFRASGPQQALEECASLDHPASRAHEQELTTDLPGRTFDSGGQGRHAMGQPTSPKEEEAHRFAREVAEHLESERNRNAYGALVLVAAPHFLGLLRQTLSDATRALVRHEIDKNLVQEDPQRIRKALPERF